jgi:hypothetical protein
MQFLEMINVYSENYMELINRLCEETAIGYGKETNCNWVKPHERVVQCK